MPASSPFGSLLLNSLLVGGLTTMLAGALGFVCALTLAGMQARARSWMLGAIIIAFALPPFLVTNTWLELLGNAGSLRRWLPFNLYSLGGTVWLLTLTTWPITALLTLGAWNRLEPEQIECEPALRGAALVRWLLWPVAKVSVGQAAAITFVLALNNFSIPVILQVPVFPEELWLAFTTRLNDAGAWVAAWPLMVAPVILVLLLRKSDVAWPRSASEATARALRKQLGLRCNWTAGLVSAALLVVSVALPVSGLGMSSRTWTELPNLFRAAPDVIWNSFAYSALAGVISIAIGLAGWRWMIGLAVWIPFLVPGVLLSWVFIRLFNGTILYGTTIMVLVAFAIRYLAIGWHGATHALSSVDRDLTDAGRLDGARGWTLFRHVTWPQIAPQLAAAWYVTYLLCLWDVETLVLIYPPGGETLALRIFNLLHYGHNAQVNAMCVLLLGLAVAPLAGWTIWQWLARRWK
jgi:iron(III) transport system permease protein